MLVTEEIFSAFLRCETKSHLLWAGVVGEQREFADWQDRQAEEYKQKCFDQLRAKYEEDEGLVCNGTPNDLKKAAFGLAVECSLQADGLQIQIHALERIDSSTQKTHGAYLPVRFIPREKITSQDKLLLAFDALVLGAAAGRPPASGKIIHGVEQKVMKVNLSELIGKAKTIVGKIAAQQAKDSPPPLILNKHCAECEFKTRCRQIAVEKDELSLLSRLDEKERKKQHSKGIFTVTQLSYTYRPRRRPKRLAAKPDNYSHALRALAIRENKIHIAGSPKLSVTGTPVYLDVEGVPDRDFYYLIGVRIKKGDAYVQHSFWANDATEEKTIWVAFLQALAQIENPQLVHYGSYETTFLKQMKQRYGNAVESGVALDELIKEAVNVLSAIYAQIYFPTYSNSLKEIAPYLGFQWSESDASGLASLVWRSEWELTEYASLKEKLLIYNAEDCKALEKVAGTVAQLCQKQVASAGSKDCCIVYTDLLKRENTHRLAKFDASLPELDYINRAAYWDYQRNKIYVRSNERIYRTSKKSAKNRAKALSVNKTIECPPPSRCPKCKAKEIVKFRKRRMTKVIHDLKFSESGTKRWVVRYSFYPYSCSKCGNTFYSKQRPRSGKKYGRNILAYIIHQVVDSHVSQIIVTKNLNLFFNFRLERNVVKRQKTRASEIYKCTYEKILKTIVNGKLLHADETKVSIGGKNAYVWVFTSLEEVIYYYTETREAEFLQKLLKGFRGVLVSDFYAAYDSINCPQQKCLIHLIRDLNNDLLKQPFNEELKSLVQEFALLLKPMIETVDRFGLKTYFLRKHKPIVERFYKELSKRDYRSEVAIYYKTRFEKNHNKLFTFLDYDGVPWNNNNAEHAVKAFAELRNVIGGSSTEKGIREYLTLLSICETCKYKGVSFLNFLRSGEKDIDVFIKKGSRVTNCAPQAG